MPYIPFEKRERSEVDPGTPGELNFAITRLCLRYLSLAGSSYITINDIMGALEGAKQEFYRRVVIQYERGKCQENGDVYPASPGVAPCES